jgi:hypothetical protein
MTRLNLDDPDGACNDIRTALALGYQPETQPVVPGCVW